MTTDDKIRAITTLVSHAYAFDALANKHEREQRPTEWMRLRQLAADHRIAAGVLGEELGGLFGGR